MEEHAKQDTEPGEEKSNIPQLTYESVNSLQLAAQWAKFLAIIGFVGTGFLLIVGLVLLAFSGVLWENINSIIPVKPSIFSALYFILGVVSLMPVVFLNNFSNQTIRAIRSPDTELLNMAFMNLRRMFLYLGMATIIILILYIIAVVAMVVGAFMLVG